MSIDEMVDRLRLENPTYVINGSDDVTGFWCSATKGDWEYYRGSVTNTDTLYNSIHNAIVAHNG